MLIKAFTMVESLFVLSIVVMLSSFTMLSVHSKQSTRNFKDHFSQLLYFCQEKALLSKKAISIYFDENEYFVTYDGNEILKYHLPNEIEISNPQDITFNSKGSISNGFTLTFMNLKEDTEFSYVFHLGSGRFYVK